MKGFFLVLSLGWGILGIPALATEKVEPKPNLTWHMVNVNSGKQQGDAHLLRVEGREVLIDTGTPEEAEAVLLPYLQNLEIANLHHVIISHPHIDHYGGLRVLLEAGIEVENLYFNSPKREICDREIPWGCNWEDIEALLDSVKRHFKTRIHRVDKGSQWLLAPEVILSALHVQVDDLPTAKIDVNDLSMILRLKVGPFSVLFPGDLNWRVGEQLAGHRQFQSNLLKMPHHGASQLAPNSFFETVDPQAVLVPGPSWVWCRERGERARQWVESRDLSTWVSGLDGHVVVTLDDSDVVITSQGRLQACEPQASEQSVIQSSESFN